MSAGVEPETRPLCASYSPFLWDADASRAEHMEAEGHCRRCPIKEACLRDATALSRTVAVRGVYAGLMWDEKGPHPIKEWHVTRNHRGSRDQTEQPAVEWREERRCAAPRCVVVFTVTTLNRSKRVCSDRCSRRRRQAESLAAP
jgi:hypothetical protein